MRKIEDILKLVIPVLVKFLQENGFFAEDTIANKLLFSREQDIKDALGIYTRQYNSLNMEYLDSICKKIRVYDALLDLRKMFEKYKVT